MRLSPRFCVRLASLAASGLMAVTLLTACSPDTPAKEGTVALVRVPADSTLAEAGSKVAPGGVILIAPGAYPGALEVRADDVTVRGEDRNAVILDGALTRANGVVMTGKRVAVENLTVKNFTQNGVLITGTTDSTGAGVARGPEGYLPSTVSDPVPGYLVQRVTAQNNGLYGIYAFNRTGGEIRENLASGGSDSGIYVGQCADCAALVADNVTELNAVGIELANASNVTITGNRITNNRIGVTALSNYLEAHGPTRGLRVVGNVISGNNAVETPEQASGAFGVGIGLSGTVGAVLGSNRIEDNTNVGVWVSSSEDFPPSDNRVEHTEWAGNGVDMVYSTAAGVEGTGNCFTLDGAQHAVPEALLDAGCEQPVPGTYTQPIAPPGIAFHRVAPLPPRPGLGTVDSAPRRVRDAVSIPALTDVRMPDADYLADPR